MYVGYVGCGLKSSWPGALTTAVGRPAVTPTLKRVLGEYTGDMGETRE
jgi:hypothetical protein